LKPSFEAIADVPLDDKGTTYRSLILQKHAGLDIKFVHHAGNSSGVVDGSGAPTLMLNAPVPAARKVLAKAGLTIDDIDLFEIMRLSPSLPRSSFAI
jgi:acetyl-CoA C-acetyltransferase